MGRRGVWKLRREREKEWRGKGRMRMGVRRKRKRGSKLVKGVVERGSWRGCSLLRSGVSLDVRRAMI